VRKKPSSLKKIFNNAVLGITMAVSSAVTILPTNIAQGEESNGFSQYLESFDNSQCKNLPSLVAPAQVSRHKNPDLNIKMKQNLLKILGINIVTDGYSGGGTRRAIAEFQTLFGSLYNRDITKSRGVLTDEELSFLKKYSTEVKKYASKYNLKKETASAVFLASQLSGLDYHLLLNSALGNNTSIDKYIGEKGNKGIFAFNNNYWLYMLKHKGEEYSLGFYSNLIKETTNKNNETSINIENPLIFKQALNLKDNKFISIIILAEYLKDKTQFPIFEKKHNGEFNVNIKKQQEALITLGFDLGANAADGWKGFKTSLAIKEFKFLYSGNEYKDNSILSSADEKLLFEYAKQAEKDEAKYNIPSPIVGAIRMASIKNNFDFAYMMELAETESSFRYNIKSKSSSAKGLYQFIETTWLTMLRKHGAKYKLDNEAQTYNPIIEKELIALRSNPRLSALISVDFQKINLNREKCYLQDREISRTDLYLSHFLGINDSIVFLQQLKKTPKAIAADSFTAAAKYNKYIFYNRKKHISKSPSDMQEVYNKLGKKFNRSIYEQQVRIASNKFKRSKGTSNF